MKGRALTTLGFVLIACLVATGFAAAKVQSGGGPSRTLAASGCQLNSAGGNIKHVVLLDFDNTHYMRDNPSVASDLEQMPHLLNFLTSNGTLFTNDHTVLISHTAAGIVSAQTGLYPDRHGLGVSNSYFYFSPTKVPLFSTAFKYWTDLVDDSTGTNDPLPNMVTDGQKNTPAPWVPFTRAGCDFGAISLANIELENIGTGPYGDMSQAFGTGSPEWNDAVASNAAPSGTAARAKAFTDYVGIAIHCANGGGICAANATNVANSRPDRLPDEPGGYIGYKALFGAKYVDPAINGGNACVNDMNGQPVTDPFGQCGFPGFDGALAKNTLGYLAQMQEAGIPITWGYISDAHDNHTSSFPAPFNPNFPRASGPGESDYVAQLSAYDDAFAAFFQRLKDDGIDQSNTLFVVTVDEGDKYAGGVGIPQPDGTLAYAHTNCSWTTTPACPSNQIGEVNLNITPKLPAGTPTFTVHRDSAPTFYVNGNPDRTDATLRKMERDVANLQAIDPYVSSSPTNVFVQMADKVEEKTLHMLNSDRARDPSFTAFGNPDYFIRENNTTCGSNPCIDYHFAWSHGDIQPVIATTWLGMAGPGVENLGIDSSMWLDHTDVRPTMLSLLGLSDDYVSDGRVMAQMLAPGAVLSTLATSDAVALGDMLKRIDAPFGEFGMNTLKASTAALVSDSNHDNRYTTLEKTIASITSQRDQVVDRIKTLLAGAAAGQPIDHATAQELLDRAQGLLDKAEGLASH
jgi:hypothetical protein